MSTRLPYKPNILPPPTLEEINAQLIQSEQASIPKSVRGTQWPREGVSDVSERQIADLALSIISAYAAQMKDALTLYRPLPGSAEAFHASTARTRIVPGSNRAGKTQLVSTEFIRIARGLDPHHKRASGNLKMLAVGRDEEHVADVMFMKCWWPGSFRIVRDEITGLWRGVRPDPSNPRQIDPIDEARRGEWKPAPPLLKPDETKIVWQKKGRGVPKLCELSNGTRLQWHTSKGAPRAGIELDVVWTDEELENKLWIPESQARLVDRNGIMVCSFTPQSSTPQYFELHLRAMNGEPGVEEFPLHIEDNPYLPAAAKQELYNDLKHDPDELNVRYHGVFAITQRRIYPSYSPDNHGIPACEIPADWLRFLAVDPGTQFSGCLFLAVPPEEHEAHVYAEVFLRNSDAQKFAEAVAPYVTPYQFETFIIDQKGSQQTPMGFSKTIVEHYSEEFSKRGLISRRTSDVFEFGSTEVSGREYSLKRWLNSSPPILRVHTDRCPILDRQMRNRYYDKNNADKREERTQHELVDCLEYLCAWFDRYKDDPEHPAGLFYRAPQEILEESYESKVHSYFLRKKMERRARGRVHEIRLGSRQIQIT